MGTSRKGQHENDDRMAISPKRYREGSYILAMYGGENAWGVFLEEADGTSGMQQAGPFKRLRDAREWARNNPRVESDALAELQDAIDYVNTHHPLPRCKHGTALRDHGGEHLYPSCGCGNV